MAVIYGTPLFLSGGGGQNLTLPPMVTDLAASTGDQTITLTWTNPVSDVLAGVLVVYNADRIPEKVSDGTKVDAGLTETVDLTGLTNETLYYIRVFPYNSKKQYQTMLEGATITATPDDFPEEPTSFTKVQSYTPGSYTFILPETGWFLLCALGKSGNGGKGDARELTNASGGSVASGGSGGTGSFAEYLLSGFAGDKIKVYIDTNNSYISKIEPTYNTENEIIKAGAGGNGGTGSASIYGDGTGGSGGAAGNATGIEGSYLQQGSAGTRGEGDAYLGGCTDQTAGVTSSYVSHYDSSLIFKTTSGYGGYACWMNSDGTTYNGGNGSDGSIIIYRGNTNQVSPSVASTLSLTPRNASIEASWTNSGDPESVGTILVSNSDHIPVHPTDGTSVDVAEATSYTITDLPNNKPSYISLFAYNAEKTKYSMAKSDVEIPREVTWYDVQEDLKEDISEAQEDAEQAQETVLLTRDFLPDAVALTLPEIYDEWNPDGIAYIGKDIATENKPASIVRRNGFLYRCLQSHTSQENWTPENSPSLWVLIDDPTIEWPEWKQPTGAHDAYSLGAKVSHNGKKWISQIAANTTEPGTDERYWKEYTE